MREKRCVRGASTQLRRGLGWALLLATACSQGHDAGQDTGREIELDAGPDMKPVAGLKGQLCPCIAGGECQSAIPGYNNYSAVCSTSWSCPYESSPCDYRGWVGDVLFVGDTHYGACFSTDPCPPTEVETGGHCLNLGLVCAYASSGCSGTRRFYACEEALDHGEWQPLTDLCPVLCPDSVPDGGTPCPAESTFCHYLSDCGAVSEAVCRNGTWSVTLNDCACADANRVRTGSPCSSPGVVCREHYPADRTSACNEGQWETVEGPPSCPAGEPAADEACHEGDVCTWMNLCGGSTQGTCSGGVWQKNASACPGSRLPSCGPGAPCEPRVSCAATQCQRDCGDYTSCRCGADGTLTCNEVLPCSCSLP
jgi:hypothetical protein